MLAGIESDKTRKFHLKFQRTNKPKGKKTNIYNIFKIMDYPKHYDGEEYLGLIKWYGGFRQYVFYPDHDTMWSKGCLELINNFLDKINKRHRNKLKKKKKNGL